MPVIRSLAATHRGVRAVYQADGNSSRSVASSRSSTFRASACIDTKPPKKKKASNAFFLYRSHVLANKLLPADITHQNDASRVAAQMWRAESQKTRAHFFAMAEDRKKEQERDEHGVEMTMPPSPVSSLTGTSSTSSTCVSPPPTPYSSYLCIPPTPKIYTCELPTSPSISLSPFWELAPVFIPEEIPEPNHDEPFLSALSDEWSSFDSTSSLSLVRASDDDAWSEENALGLYFSPMTFPAAIDPFSSTSFTSYQST